MQMFFLALFVVVSAGCRALEQPSPNRDFFSGVISAKQLIKEYPQFRAAYKQYQPSSDEITAIQSLSGKSLLVLFGTWCHDSEREVPRLLKLIDLSGVKLENLSLNGVNYNKQEPSDLHRKYDLKYSPTIILLQDKVELGRVVEKPMTSLGEDLASFITK